MNGWQLLHSIKPHFEDLPVVVIAGFISEEGAAILTDRDVSGYLVKPIQRDRMRILLRTLLDAGNLGRTTEVVTIDDDRGTLALVERALSDRGIFHHCFEDPQEGIQQIRKSRPDLAIIDLSLNGVDGFDNMPGVTIPSRYLKSSYSHLNGKSIQTECVACDRVECGWICGETVRFGGTWRKGGPGPQQAGS